MTEQEKIKHRNVSRETHLMRCKDQGDKNCSNPLAHSPMEVGIVVIDKLFKVKERYGSPAEDRIFSFQGCQIIGQFGLQYIQVTGKEYKN